MWIWREPQNWRHTCLAHSRLSVKGCCIFWFWPFTMWIEAGWVEGHRETQGAWRPNLSLRSLCLSVSRNPTKGKKRLFELPLEKSLFLLRLSLWKVGQACGFKASMAASHIYHFLGCPKRLERSFRSVGFLTEAFVLFFPLASHCLSWKVLQMLVHREVASHNDCTFVSHPSQEL